jgi:dUTP pyrophosphatase
MRIRIVNNSDNKLPEYSTVNSAGMDIRAFLDKPLIMKPFERKLIPTGLFIELPEGYEAQIRPRSGLAIKYGITVLNTPGTIDSDYRGEIGIILINLSKEDFTVNNGDRICQMIIGRYEKVNWDKVDSINMTVRGEGGFGHTDKK